MAFLLPLSRLEKNYLRIYRIVISGIEEEMPCLIEALYPGT